MTIVADPNVERLSQLSEIAFRLGKAYGDAAERALGTDRWLAYFNAFDRCFFSVRVAVALELRLDSKPPALPRAEPACDHEDVRDRERLIERDDADDDGPERDPPDRDRDREVERASFPILIRALEGVAADAAALPGPQPAELPTLRELLVKVKGQPPPAAAGPGLRARLGGSGASPALASDRRPASNVGEVLAARRATGPPRR